MRVVCTAGHVDHGKSTLVEALTGTHPDRFAEERERGLTIDLGFAWTDLSGDDLPDCTVAFVDLPGHERFVGNMLAGAGGVDVALLVVAADEGWMPQSAEHLAILDLLGVEHGVVAVTKTDLVDTETAALAVELVREELAGTTLEAAQILPVSATTGAGLPALRAALHRLLVTAPAARDANRPRLWVDRAFTIVGAGTVVTGTLQGGRVRVGDTLEVLPGGATGRVRGLQQLGRDVTEAWPGSRVAVNLASVEVGAVPRGVALGLPGQWRLTRRLEVRVRVLPGARIGRRGSWKLHAGSGVWPARVAPLGSGAVEGGEGGYLHVALGGPAALVAGDRFVLRDTGRRMTAGGGVVLDAAPRGQPHGARRRKERLDALRAREAALAEDPSRLLALHVSERQADDRGRAAAALGLDAASTEAAVAAHGLAAVGESLVDPAAFGAWTQAAVGAVRAHHAEHPVERSTRRDVPGRALVAAGCPEALVTGMLDALVTGGLLAAEGPGLREPNHAPVLDDTQRAASAALLERLAEEPFAPPRLSEAAERAGASPSLVRELEASGRLVRLAPEIAFPAVSFEAAHQRLLAAFEREGPLTAARAKEVLGTSRRFALPLLEELDRRRLTRRVGDLREVVRQDEAGPAGPGR
jgi:selenocysteine-specific elongation factor